MDLKRILSNPDDGGWIVIGETSSEAEMQDFRRSLKRNAIINTHLVNCTMHHDNNTVAAQEEHKMKVQWTKCTSALCHPRERDLSTQKGPRQVRTCPVQLRMSTCQLTYAGIICQTYQHLSNEHDSQEPLQTCVTEEMKAYIVRMLYQDSEVKPMTIYRQLEQLHGKGYFGADLMPTKIQLRNALTYLRNRKLRLNSPNGPRKRRLLSSPSMYDGRYSPPLEERRQPE